MLGKNFLEDKTLVSLIQKSYPRARPYLAIIFVILLGISSVIPIQGFKTTVSTLLGVTLLFLLFDLFTALNQKMASIESMMKTGAPKSYPNFNSAINDVLEAIKNKLKKNENVRIRILAVSAQFSWKMIEDSLPDLLKLGTKNPKIEIEIGIVDKSVLENWNLSRLEDCSDYCEKGVIRIRNKYKTQINNHKLTINVFTYNNLPHWHGIMIDKELFYMGRCYWTQGNEDLLVGQRDYRLFKPKDGFQGDDRMDLFENWFDAYKRVGKTI